MEHIKFFYENFSKLNSIINKRFGLPKEIVKEILQSKQLDINEIYLKKDLEEELFKLCGIHNFNKKAPLQKIKNYLDHLIAKNTSNRAYNSKDLIEKAPYILVLCRAIQIDKACKTVFHKSMKDILKKANTGHVKSLLRAIQADPYLVTHPVFSHTIKQHTLMGDASFLEKLGNSLASPLHLKDHQPSINLLLKTIWPLGFHKLSHQEKCDILRNFNLNFDPQVLGQRLRELNLKKEVRTKLKNPNLL